jgi:hypothetical protein
MNEDAGEAGAAEPAEDNMENKKLTECSLVGKLPA